MLCYVSLHLSNVNESVKQFLHVCVRCVVRHSKHLVQIPVCQPGDDLLALGHSLRIPQPMEQHTQSKGHD